MRDYHINVFCSDDADGYIADIPDLQHCCGLRGNSLKKPCKRS